MSFIGVAECSTAANPLGRFTKHVQDDRTLQQDRLVNGGARHLPETFRTRVDGSRQDQLLRAFEHDAPQIDDAPRYALDQIQRDLEKYSLDHAPALTSHHPWLEQTGHSPGHSGQSRSREQQSGQMSAQTLSLAGTRAFEKSRQGLAPQVLSNNPSIASMPAYSQGYMNSYPRPQYHMNLGGAQIMHSSLRPGIPATIPMASRMVELDDKQWEAQFREISQAQADSTGNSDIAAQGARQDSETNHLGGDFESLWRGMQEEKTAAGAADNAKHKDATTEDFDTAFDQEDIKINAWDGFDSAFSETHSEPLLGSYTFEEDNPFQKLTEDPYQAGVEILESGGNLSLAALAFESAVQKDPYHTDAWAQLGFAQAQNEKETPAIRALERCLTLDPDNLAALMALAISYTNEGYDSSSYRTLERWVAAKYPQLLSPDDRLLGATLEAGYTDRHVLHEKVTNLFIRAAQLFPTGAEMDPDVQVGLGVLFYCAEEYSKAVDCFEAALASSKPGSTTSPTQTHLLWNRLGATLANSGRSEEAIAAYEEALKLRPNFVRARYNLGVSCINIGVLEQAAQHLLGALDMHRVVEREGMDRIKQAMAASGSGEPSREHAAIINDMTSMNQSTNLMETLRRVFTTMGRPELANQVHLGMDVESFRREFDF